MLEIVQGLVSGSSSIECITPYAGKDVFNISLSYAIHNPLSLFDPDTADWTTLPDPYRFRGDRGKLEVSPDNKNRLFVAGEQIPVTWSRDSLIISAVAALGDNTTTADPGFEVAIELDLWSSTTSKFDTVTSSTLPATAESGSISTDDATIAPYLQIFGETGETSAVARVRVSISLGADPRRVLSNRGTGLLAIVPSAQPPPTTGTCPAFAIDGAECPDADLATAEPCSTTSLTIPFESFLGDRECELFRSGSTCVPNLEATLDEYYTCNRALLVYQSTADALGICASVEEPNWTEYWSGCGCEIFNPGAAGCVTSGSTQCCYSDSGGLLLDPALGAGTFSCISPDGNRDQDIKHFLYDTVPYLWCCDAGNMNPPCEDYYTKRPTVSDSGFEPPPPAVQTFGDVSF